jgi:hypothetical protein
MPPGGGYPPPQQGGPAPGFAPQQQPGGAPGFGGAPPGQPAPGGQPQPGGNYEFGPADNAAIEKAANRTTIWGYISIVSGLAAFVAGAMAISFSASDSKAPLVQATLMMAIHIAVGVTFIKAGKALKMVVTTRGNDVQLMMNGLHQLTSAFTIQIGVTILSVVLTALFTAIQMLTMLGLIGAPPSS